MSSFGATKNGTGTFYLPNGIIVKWGTAQSTGTKGNAPYPTPFPNDTYAAIICHASASDYAHYTAGVMNPSRLGFDFSTAPTQSTGASFYYIAIGY
ncbi:gp53-like domain-containing protein [Escherichia coli]|uniref:gp53-like domain-containing protein n=1 Tax=Escherichia coli TaxID=562 RepID=UPI003D8139FE